MHAGNARAIALNGSEQMEMQSTRSLPAPRALVWAALNDTQVLQSCIAGCERLELIEENRYAITVAATIGPVKARFNGKLTLADLDPPSSYRLEFDAQGAAAGFGKGLAQVTLRDEGASATLLEYAVKAQVGGKLAQIGSRLIDAAAKKLAADFFESFEKAVAMQQPPSAPTQASGAHEVARQVPRRTALAVGVALILAAALVAAFLWWSSR